MFIRTYRQPIESIHYCHVAPGQPPSEGKWKEMFVLMEEPLLEVDHEDLLFLKGCGITVTAY